LKRELIRQNYGLYVIAIWSVVLGVQNLVNLLLVSLSIRGISTSPLVLVYQGVSGIFSLGFFVAAVGLWRRASWGRILFLITVVLFFIVSTAGLFTPELNSPTIGQKWSLGLRYTLSAILPFVYLNLGDIKNKFKPTTEEDIDYE